MKIIPGLTLFLGLWCLSLADKDHGQHHDGHQKDESNEEISSSPLVTKLVEERSDDIPPPPPPPASKKSNEVEAEIEELKPQESKRKFAKAHKGVVPPKQRADRRGYGSHAAPKRHIIIKQAGPSKQYGWVGHGSFVPKHRVPNVFAGADIPRWAHVGNNVFEAGLVYEAPYGSSSSGSRLVPYSGSEAASTSYNLPPPSQTKATYKAPEKPQPKPEITYSPPTVQHPSPKPATNTYSGPKPAPVYNSPEPVHKHPEPVYKSPEPNYKSPVPAYKTPELTFKLSGAAYKSPESTYKSPKPIAPLPSYSPHNPFKSSKSYSALATPPSATGASATANYKPQVFSSQPNVFTAFSSGFPADPTKPNQDYQAQASVQSVSQPILPASTKYPDLSAPSNVYNIPVKVEEKPSDGEVFYIFYEDDKTANNQDQVATYVEETKPSGPPEGIPNLFNPPDDEDIRTIYVPFENAVNVPVDVDVASSFGYGGATGSSQQAASGFPNFPASSSVPTYDNPISSYDAPIYNDNSYTARNPIPDVLFREETKNIKHQGKQRHTRQPKRGKNLKSAQDSASKNSSAAHGKKVPFGNRLGPRKHYEILGL